MPGSLRPSHIQFTIDPVRLINSTFKLANSRVDYGHAASTAR